MKKGLIALVVLAVLAVSGCSLFGRITMTEELKKEYVAKHAMVDGTVKGLIETIKPMLKDTDSNLAKDFAVKTQAKLLEGAIEADKLIKFDDFRQNAVQTEFRGICKSLKAFLDGYSGDNNKAAWAAAKTAVFSWDQYYANIKAYME